MIRTAVVDDEAQERDRLTEYFQKLQKEAHEEISVAVFASGKDLLDQYDYKFDLICLDIEMEGMNGLDLAREIRRTDESVLIVFVTNMAQMAVRGYEVRAVDFLVKPVQYYSFALKMKTLFQMVENRKCRNIVVMTQSGFQKISTDDLFYAEIQDHDLFYHTKTGVFRQKSSMKELEKEVEDLSFKRCNNCYLVNLKYVDGVEKDSLMIAGDVLKISRLRKKEFMESLVNYLGGVRE